MITKHDTYPFYETHRVLMKAEDFIYLLPHPGLRNWISNYTIAFPSIDFVSDHYTVVPHGSATLVFSCDEKGICGNLFGPATIPCMVGEQANQFSLLLIIEFQPAGLFAFTGVNQRELTDQIIEFELINFRLNKRIVEILDCTHSIYELMRSLDHVLLSFIHASYPSELNVSVQNMVSAMGNISVKELSDSVFYSERHLNRLFNHYLGMNTKTFSRLVRINQAVRLLRNPRNSITNACNLAGFYDVPHFTHDFKSVCGITPQAYRDHMSDFYNEIAKF